MYCVKTTVFLLMALSPLSLSTISCATPPPVTANQEPLPDQPQPRPRIDETVNGGAAPAGNISASMVLVEGGTFQMGSAKGRNDERPVHTVTVKSFYMGKYEVTQKEWQEIMETTAARQRDMADKSRPLKGEGNCPIYYVNWYEAVEYCNRLSLKEGLTPAYQGSGDTVICDFDASGYRLPTEAEWEYAARGGNNSVSYEYSGGNSADSVAWYSGNSGSSTHPAGTKEPNSLGLYDMSGNVWEWCWDWYGNYTGEAQTNPAGTSPGTTRVLRGGSWSNDAVYVRSAFRFSYTPSSRGSGIGFRLARSCF
ncbi:MAG: formylglycine-generating enzyme family protein [Treponema sp.]|nr:formylglycine-generating enzyme family protein [Treponema sp.]